MAPKPDPKPDDPAQYQRFRDLAAEIEAEGSEEDVRQSVKNLAKHKPTRREPKPTKRRRRT